MASKQAAARDRLPDARRPGCDRVRRQFAVDGVEATPAAVVHRGAPGDRAGLLGDTTVLRLADRVHDELVGAGPLAPLLADPTVTDVLVNGVQVWVDRGAGLRAGGGRLPRPRRGAPAGPAARGGVRAAARRRPAVRGRPPARRHPAARGAAAGGDRRAVPVAAHVPAAAVQPRRPGRARHGAADGRAGAGGDRGGPAGLPGDRRHRQRQDDAAGHAARAGAADRADRAGRGRGRAAAGAPARGGAAGAYGQRGGRRARSGSPTWSGRRCGCGPTGWSSGECRGAEIVDLLGALNTGHEGGAGTLHANTPADVPARLEALGLLGGLPRAALHAQVVAALQVVLQVRRTERGRVLESVSVLLPSGEQRLATVVPAWRRGRGAGPGATGAGAVARPSAAWPSRPCSGAVVTGLRRRPAWAPVRSRSAGPGSCLATVGWPSVGCPDPWPRARRLRGSAAERRVVVLAVDRARWPRLGLVVGGPVAAVVAAVYAGLAAGRCCRRAARPAGRGRAVGGARRPGRAGGRPAGRAGRRHRRRGVRAGGPDRAARPRRCGGWPSGPGHRPPTWSSGSRRTRGRPIGPRPRRPPRRPGRRRRRCCWPGCRSAGSGSAWRSAPIRYGCCCTRRSGRPARSARCCCRAAG